MKQKGVIQNGENKAKQKSLQLSRDSSINFKAVDDEPRQVELSFSSEEPYDRWFGPEISAIKMVLAI
ncbi:hypothetical protein KHA80_14340 [Anaerobacillus sp. HL2]|nr:hypothetical protein KHA80_14340 [Anaerobacillus sp. HL2]